MNRLLLNKPKINPRCVRLKAINRNLNCDSISPEAHVTKMIKSLATYYAAVDTLNYLDASDLGANSEFTKKHYDKLKKMCEEESFKDGDKWILKLLEYDGKYYDRKLALRIIQERENFINDKFDWNLLKENVILGIHKDNKEILIQQLKNTII